MKQEKAESKGGEQKFSRRKIYFGRGICLSEVPFSSAFYRVKSLHIYNIQIVKYE